MSEKKSGLIYLILVSSIDSNLTLTFLIQKSVGHDSWEHIYSRNDEGLGLWKLCFSGAYSSSDKCTKWLMNTNNYGAVIKNVTFNVQSVEIATNANGFSFIKMKSSGKFPI